MDFLVGVEQDQTENPLPGFPLLQSICLGSVAQLNIYLFIP